MVKMNRKERFLFNEGGVKRKFFSSLSGIGFVEHTFPLRDEVNKITGAYSILHAAVSNGEQD